MTLPTKMRAVVKSEVGPGLELALVDLPTICPSDVLIKVRAASSCVTDLHTFPLERYEDAVATMASGESRKIVFIP